MADTAIAITAGTGTNVDTRTEATNGNHRQVVVLGDPATNAGVAPVDATAGLKVDLGADNDVTVTGSLTTVSTVTNLSQLGGANVPIGAGLEATAVRVTLPTDGTGVVKLGAGTNGIGKLTANSGVDIGDVDVTSCALPTGASTLAEQQTQTASLSVMDDWDNAASDGASVSGDVAHDSADAGEPVKIGGKALTAQPTAVTANDRVNGMFDIYGRQITMNSLREMKGSQITTITASTSETTVVTADATYKLDVYGVIVTNTSATATEVSFKDSTAGTTRFTISVPANNMGGFMLPMDAAHLQAAANNNWTATCADSVSSVVITMMFVKNL
jgi:hypothetical protein